MESAYLCVILVLLGTYRWFTRTKLAGRAIAKFRFCACSKLPGVLAGGLALVGQWWVLLSIALVAFFVWSWLNATALFGYRFSDDSLSGQQRLLVTLAWYSYPACLVTYTLGFVAIVRHVCAQRRSALDNRCPWHHDVEWFLIYPRDVALQVLFMPMVYHLMMCGSVSRCLSVITNIHDKGIKDADPAQRNAMEVDASTANYGLADMYDAYALWCFGNLGMTVVDRVLKTDGSPEVLSILRHTLLFGVFAYCITQISGGLYNIIVACLNYLEAREVCPRCDSVGLCSLSGIFYGANFATSSIAIYNLFSFERKLHAALKNFNPDWKFWSMKIPVSLAFFELIVLNLTAPLTGLTESQRNLVDATSKAYFMVLVAALNTYAWRTSEEWYLWSSVRTGVVLPTVALNDCEAPSLDSSVHQTCLDSPLDSACGQLRGCTGRCDTPQTCPWKHDNSSMLTMSLS